MAGHNDIAVKTIPATYVNRVLELAARRGMDMQAVLAEVGVSEDLLSNPDVRIRREQFINLLLVVMKYTQDEFLGFGGNQSSRPGTFSMMAHAVINCATLKKAILRSLKFYSLFDTPTIVMLEETETEAILHIRIGSNVEFREFLIEAIIFLSLRFHGWLIGKPIVPNRILLDFARPTDEQDYGKAFPCPVMYEQAGCQIVLDKEYMNLPLVQNERSLSKFLKDSLAQLIDGNIDSVGLPAQIRAIISKEFGSQFPDFQVICDKLNMTPQTLRRRLKDGNTSYQEIKDSIRKDASIYYLSKPDLSIDEIAMLMGFSEASSFHRAFKKWTGKTPSMFRKEIFREPS